MYAIIEDSGTQIKVSQGDVIRVAIRDLPEGVATITFDRVLLVSTPAPGSSASAPAAAKAGQTPSPSGAGAGASSPGSFQFGTPLLPGAKVTGDILSEEQADKVKSWRYSRRKNVLKRRGHRQDFLKVKITGIQA